MPISETQKDLLSYLDYKTREFNPDQLDSFTTTDIARALSISRNLCSQYLNDLVRRGLVVKAGLRPIYYFHKHNLERYLQAKIEDSSYDTVDKLLTLRGARPGEGFEQAIGYSQSLSGLVAQVRRAMFYPPCGLPVMILGASGTGKTYIVELMLAFAKNSGLLNADAQIIAIDCSQYQAYPGDIIREFTGTPEHPGWRDIAKGGLLLFKYVDLLPKSEQEYLFTQALFAARAEQGTQNRGLRFVFTSTVAEGSEDSIRYVHRLPVVVKLPAFHERTAKERRDLALYFLRDEGRRMGVDVFVTTEVLNCLTTAEFGDNISELRRSITSACAEAYLLRKGDGAIEVRAYNLSTNVLQTVDLHKVEGDKALIDVTHLEADTIESEAELFERVIAPYREFENGTCSDVDLNKRVVAAMGLLGDRFGQTMSHRTPRFDAFERLITQIVNEDSSTFSIKLSPTTAQLASQLMYVQLRPDDSLPRWKQENAGIIERMFAFKQTKHIKAAHVVSHIAERIEATLDMKLDATSQLLLICHLSLIEHIE